MPSPQSLTDFVIEAAKKLGFARTGVTDIETPARYSSYLEWLKSGHHGTMEYMADEFHKRARNDMRELLPDAQSAIVVALAYDKSEATQADDDDTPRGRVAQYALGDDYHHVIKNKLQKLADMLEAKLGESLSSRPCVDSAPLLERELAERAGLGFVAKNTMLISPGLGSYTLLGVLLTSAHLVSTPAESHRGCGSCTACIDACPTNAFDAPYKLDARRCISYLTIESQETIPISLRPKLGDRIFGCDICQDVCPYNVAAPLRSKTIPELQPRDPERARPSLQMLAELGSNQRKRYVAGNAMRRNRREQVLRNVAVALGNVSPNDPTLDTLREDRSALVQEHAAWAQAQKAP